MLDFDAARLFVAIAAGFLTIQWDHYLAYRAKFQKWERILLESTLMGQQIGA